MNKEELISEIRQIARYGYVQTGKHCRERMSERNVSTDDFLNVLLWGDLISFEKDEQYQNLKCEMKGQDINGDELTLHFSICELHECVRCITIY